MRKVLAVLAALYLTNLFSLNYMREDLNSLKEELDNIIVGSSNTSKSVQLDPSYPKDEDVQEERKKNAPPFQLLPWEDQKKKQVIRTRKSATSTLAAADTPSSVSSSKDPLATPTFTSDGSTLILEETSFTDQEEAQWAPVLRRAKYRPGEVLPSPESVKPNSPYAYAMMSWGCDPGALSESKPFPSYKGYLANMMIAAKILRDKGSKADFVVLIKMKYNSNYTRLPPSDEQMLRGMGLKIAYLPKRPDGDNFFVDQFNKLVLFNMTQYRRVMFFDGDVQPLNSLDYLFELSDGPEAILKENLVVSGTLEPANGGLWMVKPNATAYQDLLGLVKSHGPEAGKKKVFNRTAGWGHEIKAPDKWETNKPDIWGTTWEFHGGWTDQGIIYSYLKYNLQSMTQVLAKKIINFGRGPDGTTVIQKQYTVPRAEDSPFYTYSLPVPGARAFSGISCVTMFGKGKCLPPYLDFAHYTGARKPWSFARPETLHDDRLPKSDFQMWWRTLDEMNQQGHNITFTMSQEVHKSEQPKNDAERNERRLKKQQSKMKEFRLAKQQQHQSMNNKDKAAK